MMAEITITDGNLNNIQVDGNSAGDIFNAATHNPEATSDIKAAVIAVVDGLKQQVTDAQQNTVDVATLQEQVTELQQSLTNATAALTAMTKDRDRWAKDNNDLRNAQAMYLTNTEAAQEALRQMRIGMTKAEILNAVEQLKALGVDVTGIEAVIGGAG